MKKIEFFDKTTNESIGTIKYNQRNIQTLSKALKEARQINKNIFARVINKSSNKLSESDYMRITKETQDNSRFLEDLQIEIEELLDKNHFLWAWESIPEDGDMGTDTVKFTIFVDGDWKHDHLKCDNIIIKFLESKGYKLINRDIEIVSDRDISDCYKAYRFYCFKTNGEFKGAIIHMNPVEDESELDEAVHRGANGKKFWVPTEQEKIGTPRLPDDAPEGFIDGYDYWYNETDDEQFPDIVRESVYNELVIGILPQKRDGRGRWADDNHTKYKASDVLPEEGTNNIKIIMPSEEREAKARQVAAKYNLDVVKVPYKDERRKYIKHALVIVIPDDIAYMNTEDYLNSLA